MVTTERPAHMAAPRKRASKPVLRMLAWAGGALSFLSPWAVLSATPRPLAAAPPQPQVIVVKRTIKRIVWHTTPASGQPRVRYVYVSGAGGSAPVAATSGSHP